MDELSNKVNEIVMQMNPPIPFGARHVVFRPNEVGDYSIYIKENLDGILQIGILSEGKWYVSKEILSSSEGSVVYFDKKIIPDIKVGHFYDGWIQRFHTETAQSLLEKGIISLEQFFDIYKNSPVNKNNYGIFNNTRF